MRELKDIEPAEVSLVDKPAIRRKFLFFKQDGKPSDSINKEIDLKVMIESDGTVGGTVITINDEKVGELQSFDFSFWSRSDPSSAVSCSYTKLVEDKDSFKRTETFYLSKGDGLMLTKETLQLLQKVIGTEDVAVLQKALSKELPIADFDKALTTVDEYKAEFPEDLGNAIVVLAKSAGANYHRLSEAATGDGKDKKDAIDKAGAKFSKDVLAKVQAVLKAVEALKTALPVEKSSTEKAGDGDNVSADAIAKLSDDLAKLTKAVSETPGSSEPAAAEQLKKLNDELEKLTKAVKQSDERIENVEKHTGTKKGVTGQDDDGSGKGGNWPSITGTKQQS